MRLAHAHLPIPATGACRCIISQGPSPTPIMTMERGKEEARTMALMVSASLVTCGRMRAAAGASGWEWGGCEFQRAFFQTAFVAASSSSGQFSIRSDELSRVLLRSVARIERHQPCQDGLSLRFCFAAQSLSKVTAAKI
jgi:hypothetical protein